MTVRVVRRRSSVPSGVWYLQLLCLTVAVFCLGYSGYSWGEMYLYQDYEEWAFAKNLAGEQATKLGYAKHLLGREGTKSASPSQVPEEENPIASPDGTPSPEGSSASPAGKQNADSRRGKADRSRTANAKPESVGDEPRPKNQDPSLIGRILIPRVRVAAMVREGTDNRTLRRAVGHVVGTALPGQVGNIGLAAHRDSFFRGLQGIKRDDKITIKTLDGEYEYAVESIKIVRPSDVQVLAATAEPVLTLVTCYPFNYLGNAPKRFIVRARQVQAPARVDRGT